MYLPITLTGHAAERMAERDLTFEVVHSAIRRIAPLLTGKETKYKVGDVVIVARQDAVKRPVVITAWRKQ